MPVIWKNDPPKYAESLNTQVIVLDRPGEIKAGYAHVLDCHAVLIVCRFSELVQKVDHRAGKIPEGNHEMGKSVDAAIVVIAFSTPICVQTISKYPQLASLSFVIWKKRLQWVLWSLFEKVEIIKAAKSAQKVAKIMRLFCNHVQKS